VTGGPRSDLLLLYTSAVQGFIEPCGCVAGQIGGVDRIAAYVEDELADHPAALFLDTGDLFCRHAKPDPSVRRQLVHKARAFFRVWSELGCVSLSLGENDLALGVNRLRNLGREFDLPILCGNLVNEDGELVFEESVVVERGGKRIGIFSLLAPQLERNETKEKGLVQVAELVRGAGLRLQPWRKRAKRIAADLAEECDIVVLASHLGFARNRELADIVPEVDVFLGAHWEGSTGETSWVGATPVLASTAKGSRIGRVEWWWRDGGRGPGGRPTDVSEQRAARIHARVEQATLDDLRGREGAFSESEYETKVEHHSRLLAERMALEAALPPFPEHGDLFLHNLDPLYFALRRSGRALDAVDAYHAATHRMWTDRAAAREPKTSDVYLPPETCAGCHQEQYDFWLATRHSRAVASIAATMQETDAECIRCHSVGWGLPGGFEEPGGTEFFENVQCAACHGPGAQHLTGGASFVDPLRIAGGAYAAQACAGCHDAEHDPTFEKEFVQRLPLVMCPQMPATAAERPAPMRAALRGAARALEAGPEPRPWAKISAIHHRGGDDEAATRAAERNLSRRPDSPAALVLLGRRYLDAGAVDQADRLFTRALDLDSLDAAAWLGRAEAALHRGDPEAAQTAAQEALSLDSTLVGALRTIVLALRAQGRNEAAEQALDAWLQLRPFDRRGLDDLLGSS
jgi:tetratricopeptide (TPR) repeat protein